MQATNLIKIYEQYRGRWVALKSPKEIVVIASGETLKEILEKSRKKGIKKPLVTQIPKEIIPIVGHLPK